MKYLFYSLAVIVLLVVIGLAAVVFLVDPNEFRDEIAAKVEENTGRTLAIEGDIELSVFPWIGLQLGRVVLGNAPGFGPEPFAELDGAEIRVKLIPLLSKRLEVKRIVLDRLRLSLAKDARGRTNWQDLTEGRKRKAAAEKQAEGAEKPALEELMVGGLTLKEGAVTWKDRQAGKTIRIDHLNVNLDRWRFGEPAALDLGFVLQMNDPALKETCSVTTDLVVDESLQRFEFRKLKIQSRTEGQIVPSGRLTAGLGSTVVLDLAQQTLTADDFRLEAAEASLNGRLAGRSILDKPRISGRFKLRFDPRKTLATLDIPPPETSDPAVLKLAELEFGLEAGADAATLRDLKGVFDDTRLAGQLSVTSFSRPGIGFQLKLDAIDLDRYLPKAVENAPKTSAAAPSAPAGQEKPLPLDKLARLNLNGRLQIDRLKVKNLKMEGIGLTAAGNGRALTLKPRIGRFYQGDFHGAVRIGSGRQPTLDLTAKLQKAALGPLLRDLRKKEPPLEGSAFLDVKLSGRGATEAAIKRTLGGNLSFHVKDGSLTNVKILTLIKQGEAWWKGKPAPPSSGQIEKLKFVGLDFLATVRNGVVQTDRFLIDSRKLRIEGTGNIDLARERLDYTIRVLRMRHETDESGKEVARARKLPIIIDVTGPLDKPGYMLNVAEMAKARFRKKIEKQKSKLEKKVIEKLDKKLGPGIGEALKGLFSQ